MRNDDTAGKALDGRIGAAGEGGERRNIDVVRRHRTWGEM
jgi:hypothetical protein